MTIKQILGMDVTELEKLTDEELLAYLKPHIQVVEAIKPASKAKNVIDVSGMAERAEKKKENVDDFIARMTRMMQSKMETTT